MTPDIKTDRLRIGALEPSDAETLFGYFSAASVARFHSWVPGSVEDARAFIDRVTAIPFNQNDTWSQLAIRSAETRELVGDLGVHFVGTDGHQVEIGFTISPAHQRKGYAREAVLALLEHLFSVLKKHRVFASVDPANDASLALLRALALRQEAHFRESLFWKGAWVDDIVFGIFAARRSASSRSATTSRAHVCSTSRAGTSIIRRATGSTREYASARRPSRATGTTAQARSPS